MTSYSIIVGHRGNWKSGTTIVMAASNLRNAKKLLRKEMKQILNALTEEALALQSAIVTRRLLKDEVYKSARSLSIFLHMPDEVRTTNILRDALEAGKKCYVPRYFTDGGGREMEMVLLRDWDDYEGLPRTKWNIKQPADDEVRQEALDDTEVGLDLILMPGPNFHGILFTWRNEGVRLRTRRWRWFRNSVHRTQLFLC